MSATSAKRDVKRIFLDQNLAKVKVDEYLANKFYSVGYAGVDIQRTPLGTRVVIYAERSGAIIGRRGATIRQITKILSEWFGLPNPQVTVVRVEEPELNARVMAFRLAVALQRGYHFRRAAYNILRRIMGAGAKGAQVKVSGKLRGERARFEKYIAGKVYKSGNQVVRLTERAIAHVLLKPGVEGVEVIIARDEPTDDSVKIKNPEEVKEFVQKVREELEAMKGAEATVEEAASVKETQEGEAQ
ncbi:30S ribosomal protein S3 [Ignicoccus islandicus DSM 13165]|uniref:Small ribosomal subunit protein uS3 n=1 Tax=Ignicoccus islandicus DSM 13165 TaxID=940295 RepID=A0A0U3F652_9CREN|nr:30S ribosomal protein S3 [Ignicoccus islandicus]ALU11560.1 30S ribosomal protein S3 [Ignicoccus islandicus DSM 13165]